MDAATLGAAERPPVFDLSAEPVSHLSKIRKTSELAAEAVWWDVCGSTTASVHLA